MSVSFAKTGIVTASGETFGENLIIDSLSKKASHLTSGNEYIAINVGQSYMDLTSGTQVTLSFDLTMKYATSSSYFYVYNTNNKGPKQMGGTNIGTQVFDGETVGTTFTKRIYATTTITDRSDATQTDNYIEFYSNYNTGNVFSISNLKMEVGDKATPWTPNVNDWGYVGNTHGFSETGDLMKVFENDIWTTEFIEY